MQAHPGLQELEKPSHGEAGASAGMGRLQQAAPAHTCASRDGPHSLTRTGAIIWQTAGAQARLVRTL